MTSMGTILEDPEDESLIGEVQMRMTSITAGPLLAAPHMWLRCMRTQTRHPKRGSKGGTEKSQSGQLTQCDAELFFLSQVQGGALGQTSGEWGGRDSLAEVLGHSPSAQLTILCSLGLCLILQPHSFL